MDQKPGGRAGKIEKLVNPAPEISERAVRRQAVRRVG